MTILVTGGAGFVGANFVLQWFRSEDEELVNLDALTYAGNLNSLADIAGDDRHRFIRCDIRDGDVVLDILKRYGARAIVHMAAESHVDRSIHGPEAFIHTNITGTFRLLEAARIYWESLSESKRRKFRFVNVSTDEVFGSLGPGDPPFDERSRYSPNSPYSASKASADHLARSFFKTYGLPVITTHCSNNYGPRQFPEKLIPLVILNAIRHERLPVYGDGGNIRDWLYVDDHCEALRMILAGGVVGESYNIGGQSEKTNLDVVKRICALVDELEPDTAQASREELIEFVADRPGHDRRYAMNATKLRDELGWTPKETFDSGLRKTVGWYLSNGEWIDNVVSGDYQKWIDVNYGLRAAST